MIDPDRIAEAIGTAPELDWPDTGDSGKDRTGHSLKTIFHRLGTSRCQQVRFICSDLWRPYLGVIANALPAALHILDRFHIRKNLGEAIDKIRRAEVHALARAGLAPLLKKTRWTPCSSTAATGMPPTVGLALELEEEAKIHGASWRLVAFRPAEDYCGALAVAGFPTRLEYRDFSPPLDLP